MLWGFLFSLSAFGLTSSAIETSAGLTSQSCLGAPLPVSGSSTEAWVDGSLFFRAQDVDGILDGAIQTGVPLATEHVRGTLGLADEKLEAIVATVEGLGGHVRRVSTLGDWVHFRLPMQSRIAPVPSARSSAFLDRSLSQLSVGKGLQDVVHHVASALQDAELEDLVSHMMLVPGKGNEDSMLVVKDGAPTARRISRSTASNSKKAVVPISPGQLRQSAPSHANSRKLQQDGDNGDQKAVNQPNAYLLPTGKFFQLFSANQSDAVKNLGAWFSSPVMLFQCQGEKEPYLVGENTVDCTLAVDIILQPRLGIPGTSSANPLKIHFEDLAEFRKTCAQVPEVCSQLSSDVPITKETYVYGIPLYRYAIPNALYSGTGMVTLNSSQGVGLISDLDLGTSIFNYYNASALTLREVYGVDPSTQGSPETVQASVLYIGNGDSAVNETVVSEYLALLGLEPHSELRISDFGVPNNISVCDSTDNCLETMLDIQTLQSFAPNATTYFSPSSKGSSTEEVAQLFMEFLDNLLTADPRSQVASISWSYNYVVTGGFTIEALEDYLKKIAAIGMTLLVSSGDAGASAGSNGCFPPSDDGPLNGNQISQSWPTASPWVTGVGGTQFLALNETMETVEVACSSVTDGGITSGGGFSGTWLNMTTPEWQRPFVARYLKENNATTFSAFPTLETPGYNPQGRGFPDIAAYAAQFPILDESGGLTPVSGTSLAAPLAASLFTLVNQKLLSEGYSYIGYANPMLYWMAEECPEAFTDITVGDNLANEDGYPCLNGFPAAPGWDPVTGLGSINFGPFTECAKKYQDLQKYPKMSSDALNLGSHKILAASILLFVFFSWTCRHG